MRRPSSKAYRVLLTVSLVAIVAYFFSRTLIDNFDSVREIDFSVNGWTAASVLLFASAVVSSGVLWGRMVRELSDTDIPDLEAIRVHCSSWLLKYVPGQVGSIVNKIAWAKSYGVSRVLVALTFVYENVFLIVGSLVPTTIILLFTGTLDLTGNHALLAALLSLVPLVGLTNKRVFSWMSNVVARHTIKRSIPAEYFLESRQSLKYQLWYLLPRAINGLGVVAIAQTMLEPPSSSLLPLACAYVIAGAVGILAIAVPSGIGVRESVFVFLSLPYISSSEAIVLSLASRLWATLADLVVAGVYFALNAYLKRHPRTATHNAEGEPS